MKLKYSYWRRTK